MWLSATIVMFTTALFSTQTFLDTFGQGMLLHILKEITESQ